MKKKKEKNDMNMKTNMNNKKNTKDEIRCRKIPKG